LHRRLLLGNNAFISGGKSPATPDSVESSVFRFHVVVMAFGGVASALSCWQLHVLNIAGSSSTARGGAAAATDAASSELSLGLARWGCASSIQLQLTHSLKPPGFPNP
jgi:hypothetical protein